jgi:thiol-disulfide isomerase/thioredoxin
MSIILSFSIIISSVAATKPPEKGDRLPAISLPIPKNPEEQNYLGLPVSGSFKIPQIKSKVVIIEIFSMYCPYCQKDAPGVNDLYRLIENNAEIKDKVKLIGLGAGNSAYEVEVYKNKFTVPFPLFSDQDFTIHKAFGEVRTPYFIVVKIEDGKHQIVHTQLGNYPGAEPFLELVLKAAGLK